MKQIIEQIQCAAARVQKLRRERFDHEEMLAARRIDSLLFAVRSAQESRDLGAGDRHELIRALRQAGREYEAQVIAELWLIMGEDEISATASPRI